jgi:alkylation response protein AidB-like acyl-CoA dehydrogenase
MRAGEITAMDFRFTPEQEQFRDSVRRFAEKELAPGARERPFSQRPGG